MPAPGIWVNSGSWWWTGRPGMLRFMGLQRVGHDWVTELNWTGKFKIMYVACLLFLWDSSHLKALITFEWTSLASDGRKQFCISTFIFQSFHTVKLIIFGLQLMNFNTWIDLRNHHHNWGQFYYLKTNIWRLLTVLGPIKWNKARGRVSVPYWTSRWCRVCMWWPTNECPLDCTQFELECF